jgi:hypothetical protein
MIRKTSDSAPTQQLTGPQSTARTDSSHRLTDLDSSVGKRSTSLLSRIKKFFKSIGKFFANLGEKLKALRGSKATLGEASEPRRTNALKSPGPKGETRTEQAVQRERSQSAPRSSPQSSPLPQPRDIPGREERPHPRRVESGGLSRSEIDALERPLDDDDDQPPGLDDSGPSRSQVRHGGNGPEAPRDDRARDEGGVGDEDRSRPLGEGRGRSGRSRAHGMVDRSGQRTDRGGESRTVGAVGSHELPTVMAGRGRALQDPGLAQLSTGGDAPRLDGGKLIDFMGKHVVATSSPSFWATTQAKGNVATLGGALAFSVIDKVKTAGQMNAQDRADFMRALQLLPRDPNLAPLTDIPDDMLGALDDNKLAQLMDLLTDMLMSVYGGSASAHPLPGADYFDAACQDNIEDAQLSGAPKVDVLRQIFIAAVSDEHIAHGGMKPDGVKQALEAMS